jgi:hypothetical protein
MFFYHIILILSSLFSVPFSACPGHRPATAQAGLFCSFLTIYPVLNLSSVGGWAAFEDCSWL